MQAYKAPFAMLAGLYSGLNEEPVKLSMTEDELKQRAQPLTDTDLSDKQQGERSVLSSSLWMISSYLEAVSGT